MGLIELFDELSADVLTITLASIRLLVAFLVIPLFSEELIPPLVRNAVFVVFAMLIAYVQPGISGEIITGSRWLLLSGKEAFVGLTIGLFFGMFLWAFESAGTVIDTQTGASMATNYDPIAGHEVTLLGDLLERWATVVFVSSGGLLLLVTALLDSFTVWPLDRLLPDLRQSTAILFQSQFGALATLTIMIAAPILVVLFVIDMLFGLLNRFAKRIDILFISMAAKGLVALTLIAILIPVLLDVLLAQIQLRDDTIDDFLRNVLTG